MKVGNIPNKKDANFQRGFDKSMNKCVYIYVIYMYTHIYTGDMINGCDWFSEKKKAVLLEKKKLRETEKREIEEQKRRIQGQ